MATKRTPSSDFEHPPIQPKHLRSDAQANPPTVLVSSSEFLTSTESTEVPEVATSPSRQPICSVEPKSKVQLSVKSIKSKVIKNRKSRLAALKSTHNGLLKEKYFLEGGKSFMDFMNWMKKPNILREQFLKQHDLESVSGSSQEFQTIIKEATSDSSLPSVSTDAPSSATSGAVDSKKPQNLPSATTIQIPLSTVSPSLHATPPKGTTPLSPARSITFPSSSPRPATRAHASFSSVYESSHEDIVMRARHEAEVMKAIAELRKEGLWHASRLPKVQEPPRIKTHWNYLLEEMQWLATDFANEKRWKINAARKVCTYVSILFRKFIV